MPYPRILILVVLVLCMVLFALSLAGITNPFSTVIVMVLIAILAVIWIEPSGP